MPRKKTVKTEETISKTFHSRKNDITDEQKQLLTDFAERHRDARNRVSKRLYHSNKLKRALAYGELKGNGRFAPFLNLRQSCESSAFQQDMETVFGNFESRLAEIEYHASKEEQKTDPLMVRVKQKLVTVWKPTAEEMIGALESESKHVSQKRQEFLAQCIHLLETNRGLFPLIQKYQQRFLNGMHKAVYRSLSFASDNMWGSKDGCSFLERIDEKNAVAHIHFPEVIRKVKNTYYNKKTGVRTAKNRWLVMREDVRIDIPVRYNEKYHGEFARYADSQAAMHSVYKLKDGTVHEKPTYYRNEKFYTMSFKPNGTICIGLTITREKKPPLGADVPPPDKVAGVDINFRDNALKLDDGWQWQWSPELLKDLKYFLEKLAKRNMRAEAFGNMKQEWSRPLRAAAEHIQRRAEAEQNFAVHLLVKHLKKTWKEMLVAEDIQVKGWRLEGGRIDDDLKNRTAKQLLKFGNWKNVFERICKREGIKFALTNSHYTSKTCPVCGNIADENRPFSRKTERKDVFKCTRCGHLKHPDVNAARVIAGRMAKPEVRTKLQWFNFTKDRWEDTSHQNIEFYRKVYQAV